jgi:hypothetical protein
MTDNKRAADDAEREKFNAWFKSERTRIAVSPSFACKAWARAAWQAALSSRADGGKGEAVAYVFPVVGSGATDLQGNPGVTITAPQAECAPREAQPIYQVLNVIDDTWSDTDWMDFQSASVEKRIVCLATPTPERADADTAGAKPGGNGYPDAMVIKSDPCACCGGCGCFACLKNNPASQERADAGKDAALLEALRKIAAIENKMYGGDWDEIEEARSIASIAILAAKEKKS